MTTWGTILVNRHLLSATRALTSRLLPTGFRN
jgi:hypothetical protein